MVQNDIRFVLTAPLTPEGEIAEHVRAHGDGVHDIAFAVDDVTAWRETTTRAVPSRRSSRRSSRAARTGSCAIDPDLRRGRALVRRARLHRRFAPGYQVANAARAAGGSRAAEVDHCVGNVELGQMNEWVKFYPHVMGFPNQLIHYDDKTSTPSTPR